MALGQIDPARLDGDALRRWYLRSPADIEEERRRSASQQYDRFFGGLRPAGAIRNAAKRKFPEPVAEGLGDEVHDGAHIPARRVGPQAVAMAATEGPAANGNPIDCLSCHGRVPPLGPLPLPPPLGGWPWPGSPPFFRDLPGGPPPPPRREERKQCEMQEQSDRGICSQQPTEAAKAECYSNIVKRRYHCDQTGETGIPRLFTARRKSGRRWP